MARKKTTPNNGLNEEQNLVFESFRKGANIYLCGKGGSGKSHLTRHIIDYCKAQGKEVLVCAPTGIAALNVGGATIHRTFGVPFGIVEPDTRCYNKKKLEVLSKADVIIIDEISMCRIDVFEYVANTLLYLSPKKQLLVVGDFYQLPPVLRSEDGKAYSAIYGNRLFAFESERWQQLGLQTMELQTSMRQKDKAFVSALDNIRAGIPDLDLFQSSAPDPTALTVCGTNGEADTINSDHLKQLKKDGAVLQKLTAITKGSVDPSERPTENELTICVGARIVMLNNDKNQQWVNGSFATVTAVSEQLLHIRLENGIEAAVEPNEWKFVDYDIERRKDGNGTRLIAVERGSFTQFPVRLAWAITIHKSQGQTYERVNVNVSSIFAEGQLYVALSRCKTLKGMNIIGKLTPEKVITSEVVLSFMKGDHRPELNGQLIPFYDDEQLLPSDDRYQQGYDDGYKDGTDDTEAKYQQRIEEDPGVKVLSDFTRRQHELAQIEDPTERNPKGAGRKKLPVNERKDSKAIRVPGELADLLKEIGNLAKQDPDSIQQLLVELRGIIDRRKQN